MVNQVESSEHSKKQLRKSFIYIISLLFRLTSSMHRIFDDDTSLKEISQLAINHTESSDEEKRSGSISKSESNEIENGSIHYVEVVA